jgi:hypothetical protein
MTMWFEHDLAATAHAATTASSSRCATATTTGCT